MEGKKSISRSSTEVSITKSKALKEGCALHDESATVLIPVFSSRLTNGVVLPTSSAESG